MLHPEDHDKLKRILRTDNFSQAVLQEYDIRKRMNDSCGSSGPLGAIGLIDMVRSMKLTPVVAEVVPDKIDWRTISRNGTVRIKAMFYGSWVGGTYFGFGDDGTLEVQMDHEDRRRHMPRHALRLADEVVIGMQQAVKPEPVEDRNETPVSDTPVPDPLAEADTDVYEEFTQPPGSVSTSVQRPERPSIPIPAGDDDTPYQQHDGGVLTEIASSDAVAVVTHAPEVESVAAPPVKEKTDWAAQVAGQGIWVELDGDYEDAKFQSVNPDGTLLVTVDGEAAPRIVSAELAYLA